MTGGAWFMLALFVAVIASCAALERRKR